MMSDIHLEENNGRGRYVLKLDNGSEAEMTFSREANGTMVVFHTGVPDAYAGKGIAGMLMQRLIADAQTQGFHIKPVCSYVAAQFKRHPEWADLLAP